MVFLVKKEKVKKDIFRKNADFFFFFFSIFLGYHFYFFFIILRVWKYGFYVGAGGRDGFPPPHTLGVLILKFLNMDLYF